jgi:acetyltransferase-like isoleucine patch superfamily enzyme
LAQRASAFLRVGGAARRPAVPRELAGCDAVGADAAVHGRPHVENLGRLTIGDRLRLHASPIATHLITGPEGELAIGSDVRIGHGSGLVAHASIRIGNGASLGAFVMVLDTDFHVAGARDARPVAAPIEIGAGAWIGNSVTILRGSVIGAGARVAPGSVVSGVVAPGAEVAGVPARPVGAGAERAAAGSTAETVLAVARQVTGRAEAPDADQLLDALPGWDSLAALNLLLSLEGALGVELPAAGVSDARTLGDLVRMADAAVARAGAREGTA